ncbi:hypothetical protein B4077_3196 [Bacillus cereus]|uniref:Uncharacterized protein n=1 Tax=Bacillus cereus TaxID=1396 RepID=A0A0G8EDR7_BACCE|nr:hypothetical protein B4077_3196 [Bacillus cereus]
MFPDYVKNHSTETGVLIMKFKGENVQMSFNLYIIRINKITPTQGQEK